MKHFYSKFLTITLVSVVSLFSSAALAQQLPDPGFEDWSGASFNGVAQNKYWNLSNVEQSVPVVGTFRFNFGEQTDGRTGSAMKVYDKEVGAAGVYQTAPGYTSLGKPWQEITGIDTQSASGGLDGGIKFTYRPDSLVAWIKRTGNNVTKENYNIVFYSWVGTAKGTSYKNQKGACRETTHYDEESDIRQKYDANSCNTEVFVDQIAEGWIKEKVEYTDWTRISVPIKYMNLTQKPEKCNVILSAGNYPNFRDNSGIYDGNTLIIDDIQLIYNSTIDELRINDTKVRGFSASTTDFTKANEKTSYQPATEDFTLFRSGRKLDASEYSININGAAVDNDKPVIITVKAEDGSSTTIYNIKFTSTQSTNYRPESITYKLGDTEYSLPNWNANAFNYEVSLPFGTTATPQLVVVTAEPSQTTKITQPSGPNGTGSVVMTAQSGATGTYTIKFSVAQLSDNTLKNILLNGEALTGFSPTKNNYEVELPLGTTTAPTITWESNYPNGAQTIALTSNELSGSTGKATITVKVPGNSSTRTYTLNYVVKASSYALLEDIKIGGTTIEGFIPSRRSYSYNLPMGTKTLPAVTYTKGQAGQTVTVDDSGIQNLSGDYIITVKAEDGTIVNYYITFTLLKSSNVDLAAIYLNGSKINSFKADVLDYEVEIDATRTEPSVVTVDKGESDQTVVITKFTEPTGTISIRVTAADGVTRRVYTVTAYQNKSSDNTLKEILINGTKLEGFTPDQTEYTYTYSGTKPTVTYTLNDATATATSRERNGVVTINITAQDGSKNTYYVTLTEETVEKSDYAYLDALYVDGVAVSGFTPTTLEYNFPLSTWAKPSAVTATAPATVTIGTANITWNTRAKIYKATIKATAEDGKTENTYTITFVEGQQQEQKSNDATLSSLTIDGTSVAGFSSTKTDYSVTLPAGTTTVPVVAATANDSKATATVTQATSVSGTASVKVTAEDGTVKTYTITFSVAQAELDADASLSAINLNGKALSGFSATTYTYSQTIPFGGNMPTVTATASSSKASVDVKTNGMQVVITVTAEAGNTQAYTINFTQEGDPRSSDASLKDLTIDGVTISGFSATKTNYTYEIPFGGVVPVVAATANDSKAQAVVTQAASTNGKATIVVTAENGSTQTYTIQFSEAGDTRSGDATLSDLTVDGVTIDGFSPNKTSYTYQIAFGGSVPVIAAIPNHSAATVEIKQATSIADNAVITVTAENGNQKTYTISFTEASDPRSTDAALKTINIDIEGTWSPVFRPAVTEYTYTLPAGTTTIPQVSCETNNSAAVANITQAATIDGTATITVQAEHPDYQRVYTIHFVVAKNSNANLSAINLNDQLISGFDPQIITYRYTISYGDELPTITYIVADPSAQAEYTPATAIPGIATIKVTAEDGTTKTYTIRFVEAADDRSTDASLSSITINEAGSWNLPFLSGRTSYIYTVPVDVTEVPTVDYVLSDAAATADYTPAAGIPGEALITVTAENPAYQTTYRIRFEYQKSGDATLAELTVGGELIEEFDPQMLTYNYQVAFGTTQVPVVNAVANDANSKITIIPASTLSGATLIYVVAEDGTTAQYQVNFSIAPDTRDNSINLSDIIIDGNSVEGFDANLRKYNVELPSGTVNVPAVEAIAENDKQQLTIQYQSESLPTTAVITVTAENGTKGQYLVSFTVAKSQLALLDMIYIDGVELNGFAPETFDYTYNIGFATQLPIITVDKQNSYQVVDITTPRTNEKAFIDVTSEDHSQTTRYTITFEGDIIQIPALNPQLTSLSVNGQQVDNFNSDTYEYTVDIPEDIVSWSGLVTYQYNADTKSADEKRSDFVQGGEILINLTATDDSTVNTYKVNFHTQLSSVATLDKVFFGGVEYDAFNPNAVEFDCRNRSLPVLTYKKAEDEQRVIYTEQDDSTVVLNVTAADGVATHEYVFHFQQEVVNLNGDPTLKSITIGSETKNFDESLDWDHWNKYRLNMGGTEVLWTVDMPEGVDALPDVSIVPNADNVKATYTQYELADGRATLHIQVVPEDQSWADQYIVEVNFHKSQNNQLSAIAYNGIQLDMSQGNVWNIDLPLGTEFPDVTYQLGEEHQSVVMMGNKSRQVVLSVRAQDETIEPTVYVINFTKGQSSNTALAKLFIGGHEFLVQDQTVVDVQPKEQLPEITYEPAEPEKQRVLKLDNGRRGTTILVVAEDGTQHTYNVTYNFIKNNDATLKDLQVLLNGSFESIIDNSDAEKHWTITLPRTVEQVPVVMPIPTDSAAQVTVNYGLFGQPTTIRVVSEDGNTTSDFEILFDKEKSSDATLDNVEIKDNTTFIFNASQTEYKDIPVPYGTTARPAISWEKADPNQKVTFVDAGLTGTSKIIVTAEDGQNTNTYSFTFRKKGDSEEENKLTGIYVNNKPAVKGGTDYEYSVTLPYGTTDCDITYTTAYPGQTVFVTNNGLNSASTLRVYSNVTNVSNVTYTLNIAVNPVPNASLTGITIDGSPLAGFDPQKYDYLYVVEGDNTPVVDYSFDEQNPDIEVIEDVVSNVKQVSYIVKDALLNEENTYNVYFYYAGDDEKLNMDFENWENAAYSETHTHTNPSGFIGIDALQHKTFNVKPTGWFCAADVIEKFPQYVETYWSGEEVNVIPNDDTDDVFHGSHAVQLFTQYQMPIAASTPGCISLSTPEYEMNAYTFATNPASYCRYSNPIQYRNTPDNVSLWYKGIENNQNKIPGWTFYMKQIGEDNQTTIIDDNCKGQFIPTWTQYSHEIAYPNAFLPSKLDVRIAASDTTPENMRAGTGGARDVNRYRSKLYVDYMQFHYNSTIASGNVVNTTGAVSISGNDIQVNITDETFAGEPIFVFVNEQPYYQHTITWNDNTYTSGTVRSFGEDGSYTDYTLSVSYAQPSSTNLKDILIDGVSVGTDNTINYPVPFGTTSLPNITFVASNSKQVVNLKRESIEDIPGADKLNNNRVVVTVYAHSGATTESDPHSTYTITFVETQASENKLVDIKSNGNLIEEPFDAEKTAYTTVCEYSEPFQTITYTKASDGQQVVMTIDSISDLQQVVTMVVTPEDNSSKKTYTVTQTKNKPAESTGLLTEVAVGAPISPLVKSPEVMTTDKSSFATDINALATFSRAFNTDTVIQIINFNKITWQVRGVNGQNEYQLLFNKASSATYNAQLSQLTLTDIDNNVKDFEVADYTEFNYETNAGVNIVAVQNVEGQLLTPSFDNDKRQFTIAVKSADELQEQNYQLTIDSLLSDIALLESVEAAGYTLSPALSDEVTNYTLTPNDPMHMPHRAPRRARDSKLLLTQPSIMANAKGEVGSIAADYGENEIYLDVTSQKGSTKSYVFTIVKSANDAALDDISVMGKSLSDYGEAFSADKEDYSQITLPYLGEDSEYAGIIPMVGYQSGIVGQNVTVDQLDEFPTEGTINIHVSAPNGSTKDYSIPYKYAESGISHNAKLAALYVDEQQLQNINDNDNPMFDNIEVSEFGLVSINPIKAEDKQNVEVSFNDDKSQAVVSVTAEDGATTNTYTLNFVQLFTGSDNTAIDIYLNGKSVSVPVNGSRDFIVDEKADVTWLTKEVGQQVLKSGNGNTIALTVTAPDHTTEATYTLNIAYKNVSYIADLKTIRLDGKEFTAYSQMQPYQVTPAQFLPQLYSYRIDLPLDRQDTLPTIDAVKAGNYQTVTWNTKWRDGNESDTLAVVTINVVTPNNFSQREYQLNFIKYLDKDATPADILIDNIPIAEYAGGQVVYDPSQTDYVVKLDTNMYAIPTVTVLLKEHQDTISVVRNQDTGSNPHVYKTDFVVQAQAGNVQDFHVTLQVPQDNRNTLSDLQVNGRTIAVNTDIFTANKDFSSSEYFYNVTFPALTDTAILPIISYTTTSPLAQAVVTGPEHYNGVATITVTPFYGNDQIYEVHFALLKDTVSTLNDLQLNGATIEGFDPQTQHYNVELVRGSVELPQIDGFAVSPRATVSVSATEIVDRKAKATITVTAEAGNTRIYTIDFTVAVDNNVKLSMIQVDGADLLEYDASVNSYALERDTLVEQAVVGIKANEWQQLEYSTQELADGGKIERITVTAESGAQGVYTLTFTMPVVIPEPVVKDSDAHLAQVIFNTEELTSFDSETFVYDLTLERGTKYLPAIEAIPVSDKATVEYDSVSINNRSGRIEVRVTSEAGTFLTYRFNFSVIVDSNTTLQSITLGGNEINGYDANTPTYEQQIAEGDSREIGYVKADEMQEVKVDSVVTSAAVVVTITVTAESGDKGYYVLTVVLPEQQVEPINPDDPNKDATLQDITIDGFSINDLGATFSNSQYVYSLTLDEAEWSVVGIPTQQTSTASTTSEATGNVKVFTIEVTPQEGDALKYTVIIAPVIVPEPQPQPEDCTDQLEGLRVNGDDWNTCDTISAEFNADLMEYTLKLSAESPFPVITGFLTDPDNSCLSLSYGTREIDEYNHIDSVKVVGVDNNGFEVKNLIYIINVYIAKTEEPQPIDEECDSLANILVDSIAWDEWDSISAPFSPSLKDYTLYLPAGSAIPDIQGQLIDPDSSCLYIDSVDMTNVDEQHTTAVIYIDSLGAQLTYTVNIVILPFSDASIQYIDIDGKPLAGFRSDSMYYVVNLPVGTREYFQTLECYMNEEHAAYDTIRLDNDEVFDYDAHYQIHTTAQSGDTLNYFIDFVVAKSDNANLSMIYFTDSTEVTQTLDDYLGIFFDAEVTTYTVVLPRGTKELPIVTYDLADEFATAQIDSILIDSVNGTLNIVVTAENGEQKTYSVIFGVEVSSKALLEDVTIEVTIGDSTIYQQLNNFDPRTFDYFHTLPYGINSKEQVTIYYDAEPGITIHETRGATLSDTTYVTVTAEDGETQNVYTIVFDVARSTNASPLMLYVDGVAMDTTILLTSYGELIADTIYDSLYYEYNIILPAGMDSLPEVTALAADTQQVITINPVDSTMTVSITVVAGAGRPINEYTIYFQTAKYGYNTLDDLLVNGVTVDGFRPDSNDYVISYPAGTSLDSVFKADDITWVVAHPTETVTVSQSDSLTYMITVTAENGSQNVYLLNIVIALSDNALLDSLLIDGVMIRDFEPEVFDYTYYLYAGQQITDVVGIPQDSAANVTVIMGVLGEEYTLINVIAEDDSTMLTYRIWFQYLDIDLSSDADYEEVCIRHLGGNTYKAASMKKNVQLCIYDIAGHLLKFVSVPVIEANEDLCDGDTGVEFELDGERAYIYTFFNNQTRKVTRGKIMHIR